MSGYIPVVKFGTQIVTGLGVGKIVGDIVKNNVSIITTADKVKVWTGMFVITSIAVEQTNRYIDRTTDSVVDWLEKKDIIDTTKQ